MPEERDSQTIQPIRAQLQNTETNIPCNVAFLGKLIFPKIFKKLLTLVGTRNIYSRVHKSLLLIPTLSRMERVHAVLSHFFNTHCIIILHLDLGLPSGLFYSGFPIKTLYSSLFPLTCSTHVILLHLTTIMPITMYTFLQPTKPQLTSA